MTNKVMRLTDESIRRLAIERLGCVDANVCSYSAWCEFVDIDPDTGSRAELNRGRWFVLAVKWRHGGNFEVVARRRTFSELVKLVESRQRREAAA